MGEVVQFVSRSTAAEKNLEAFVSLARDKLTAFAEGGAWDEVKWRNKRVSVVFCKYRPRNEARRRPVPLAEPFLSFAKAYFRYRYSHKPVTSVAIMLDALRMIELALIEATGGADIRDLNVPVLQLSVRFCKAYKKNETARYQSGRQIEAVADFCREHAPGRGGCRAGKAPLGSNAISRSISPRKAPSTAKADCRRMFRCSRWPTYSQRPMTWRVGTSPRSRR